MSNFEKYRDRFIKAKKKEHELEQARNILVESINMVQAQRVALFRTVPADYDAIIDREVALRALMLQEEELTEDMSDLQIELTGTRAAVTEALTLAAIAKAQVAK